MYIVSSVSPNLSVDYTLMMVYSQHMNILNRLHAKYDKLIGTKRFLVLLALILPGIFGNAIGQLTNNVPLMLFSWSFLLIALATRLLYLARDKQNG